MHDFTGHVRELTRKATLGFVTLGAVRGQGKCLPDVFRKILREGEVKARPAVRTAVKDRGGMKARPQRGTR